ncbi:MAG: hypothetical protein WC558_10480 [Patulibacter sp.]
MQPAEARLRATLAEVRETLATRAARTAERERVDGDAVPDRQTDDLRPELDDDSRELMAHHRPRGAEVGRLEVVQIRSADAAVRHVHADVTRPDHVRLDVDEF